MHDSWKPIYFGVKRSTVKVTRHKKQCRRGFLHSCECWLLVIVVDDSSGCVCDSGGDDAYDNDNGGDGINNISSTRA